ncbi:hypothetical protein D1831_00805 [Lactiplantibacillus garii]|uniref:Uncharacterized protein n=1 Tax=Lactiplantibacillus garii TaxID=2306423 RepID=A0A3R8KKJ5_9LACO|nr:hypothetical protein [Lactiplantibacillus garii]RRK11647.1 hypothetical protein D1831_00805 [Lactiplantibacillus garii]
MHEQSLTVKYDNQSKILKWDPLMLYVRVRPLEEDAAPIHCIVVKHALTLFYQLQPDARLALYGHYNRRHQFVITKFMVGTPVQSLAS